MMNPALSAAPKLETDLATCARALEEALAVLREKERTAPTPAGRSLAERDREAAEKLLGEPFFGWLEVDESGKRAYRIGKASFTDLRIVDWRHPIAKLFFETAPGEAYERAAGGRTLEGVVVAQGRARVEARALQHLAWHDAGGRSEALRDEAGFVDPHAPAAPKAFRPPQHGLPDVLSLLTPEQYRLIARSSDRPLIIQGQAGSGKTSVALHRLSWLAYPGEGPEADGELAVEAPPVEPARALIVMFNKALSTYVRASLAPLKLEAAKLDTFHGWALETVRAAYKGQVEPRGTPLPGYQVAKRLKAQLGMLSALEAFVRAQTTRLEGWLEEKLRPLKALDWLERFRASEGPVVRRLIPIRKAALEARDAAEGAKKRRLGDVYEVFRSAVTRTTLYKEELLRLLSDRALLRAHLPGATDEELEALAAYQAKRQGEKAPEGKKIGLYVDFDDLGLLIRLIQLKHGGLPNADEAVELYDHLVIDEAQDFGAIQLHVLLGTVRSRTGVTIVGDVNQKILPEVDFIGWEALAGELGLGGVDVARLEVPHRSTAPIMRLADFVSGIEASGRGRSGPLPLLERADHPAGALERAAAFLRARIAEAPGAHLCVVCSTKAEVESALKELRGLLDDLTVEVREGHNASFKFEPGITVTNWQQVKGLEFDAVVALNPSPTMFADTAQGRRNLYVVATRARDELAFFTHGEVPAVLERAIEAGLVEESFEPGPVSLGDEDEPI